MAGPFYDSQFLTRTVVCFRQMKRIAAGFRPPLADRGAGFRLMTWIGVCLRPHDDADRCGFQADNSSLGGRYTVTLMPRSNLGEYSS